MYIIKIPMSINIFIHKEIFNVLEYKNERMEQIFLKINHSRVCECA